MIEVVYVIRHAFRANWVVNPHTGEYTASTATPTGIPTDPPLAAHGVAQSVELANYLCRLEPPIDRIYSSPFSRCLQTLKPATDRLFAEGKAGGKIRIDRGIGEFFGRANFEHPTPPGLDLLNPLFEHLDQNYESRYIPASRGESLLELHERVKDAMTAIVAALDDDSGQPKALLICTHAATMIAIGRALTGCMPSSLEEDDFQCYTASLSKFKRRRLEPTNHVLGEWDCVLNSETSYLSGGKFNGEESFISFPDPPKDDKHLLKL
ncbi:phosphoglycerate mutase family protein [Massariosphaeria phaeospora]|uniref:Phosphoglycerate mutase family protein n=1 Tax=Massariosphaeria phaeospora TaxID=100035 RepID=A0A7C8MC25_9PLEO|nr:phosphoglycerate mutase family protein [Massariosphaeria phaeospora]